MQIACKALLGPPLAKVKEINFSYSPFSKNGCTELGEYLEQSDILTSLNLTYCGYVSASAGVPLENIRSS